MQSAFGCGYEGNISKDKVLKIIARFLESGQKNISLADTAGHATPDRVEEMFSDVIKLDKTLNLTCHFHNTYGMGLANVYAAMRAGVKYFETAVSGIGGCPFAKIAGGNVSTEDFVHMLQRMNMRTDVDLDKLIELAQDMARFFNREMPGVIWKSGKIMKTNND